MPVTKIRQREENKPVFVFLQDSKDEDFGGAILVRRHITRQILVLVFLQVSEDEYFWRCHFDEETHHQAES